HESFPWTGSNSDRALVEQLRHMIRHEQEVIAAMARFLARQHSGPPYLGAFPTNFTSYNFLEADRLLPLLIEHETVDVNDLENDLSLVQDEQARELLDRLLRAKKEHLATLKGTQEPAAATDETVISP